MVAMNEDNCMVDVARYFLSFTAEESCGQCVPCRVGTRRMLQILERITEGKGTMEDIGKLEHLAVQVRDGSLCALGGSAPNPVLTTLRYFRHEFEDHIGKGKCGASVCASLFLAPCQNTCPAGTNVPGFISLISEGNYIDAYAMNKEDNPFPSVCGRICDHPCESRCNRNQLDGNLNVWALKRYCSDRAFALSRDKRPKPTRLDPTGKRIAVVGGGPSGLSAAYFLARLGHSVTIY
jgi:NADH-quinone oxidoreductase subunit F